MLFKKKRRDRDWVKRAGKFTILWWPQPNARPRLYLQCLSPWRQLLTSAPAQGNPKLHQGIREEKSAKPERRTSPLLFAFPVRPRDQKKKKKVGRGAGVQGDVEGYNENMSAGSHSSITPKWTAFCDYTENKVKVKIEELTGVQQLYLYLTCTVCLQTQSQLSLYSINLSVKGSVNKAIQMDGVMLWEFNRELVYIHRLCHLHMFRCSHLTDILLGGVKL